MGQVSVIAALAALFIGGLTLYYIQGSTNAAESRLGEHQRQQLARDAAEAGLELVIRQLADSANVASWNGSSTFDWAKTPYGNGSFEVDAEPCVVTVNDPCADADPGDIIDVDVVGHSGGTRYDAAGNEIPIRHLILARFERRYADGGLPPQFRYGIIADNLLLLQGDAGAFSTDPTRNVNVHSNGDIDNNGNSFLVEGYGTYSGNNLVSNQGMTNFLPWPENDYNGDDPNVFHADPVPIIPLDSTALRAHAAQCGAIIRPELLDPNDPTNTVFSVNGDDIGNELDLSNPALWPWPPADYPAGAITLNTNAIDGVACGGGTANSANPFVLLVEGDATFTNTTHVRGFANLITMGNFTIAATGSGGGMYGDVVDVNGNEVGGTQTKVLAGAFQDMYIGKKGGNTCFGLGPQRYTASDGHDVINNHCKSGSGDFEAGITMQVEGTFIMRGTPYIVGGLVARTGDIDDGGSPKVFYATPVESILDPGFDFIVPIGPILIAYSEWQCGLIDAAGNDAYNCTL